MATIKGKSAKWKVPGKGAGPAARRDSVTTTLQAFDGKFDKKVYTFAKLDKVLYVQFTDVEQRAYDLYTSWNADSLSSERSQN